MEFISNDSYVGELDYVKFGAMLDSPTQCYKFYWLEAIMNLFQEKSEFTFDEIFNEMIILAWYSVTQYHLFLGPMIQGKRRNAIEEAIEVLLKNTDLNEFSLVPEIRDKLKENANLIKALKNTLSKNVPYRLLTSFVPELRSINSDADRISKINEKNKTVKLPYVIKNGIGCQKKVIIQMSGFSF